MNQDEREQPPGAAGGVWVGQQQEFLPTQAGMGCPGAVTSPELLGDVAPGPWQGGR